MNHNRLKLFNFKWSSILRFKKKLTCRHSAKIYNLWLILAQKKWNFILILNQLFWLKMLLLFKITIRLFLKCIWYTYWRPLIARIKILKVVIFDRDRGIITERTCSNYGSIRVHPIDVRNFNSSGACGK